MASKTLELIGNLQIEAATHALKAAGAKPDDIYPLLEHLLLGTGPTDDLHGQQIHNVASFTGERGLILKHMIMRGLDRELIETDLPRMRRVAAQALRDVLVESNQEVL